MVLVYKRLVLSGLKEIEDVPENIREEVRALVEAEGKKE